MTKSYFKIIVCVLLVHYSGAALSQSNPKMHDKIRETMMKATTYMVEVVSTQGGYVGLYFEDLSRRWGELEAYETMIWVQDPGTVSMGNLFLDAFHATGDEYYYHAAEKVARALIWGQLPVGGWNYMIDFAGDGSLKNWYRTIGKNAWGFEEHNQHYGNATFDDVTTSKAAEFLLRIYLERLDPEFKPPLDKAINFIIEAQYPLGGWPQRYPLMHSHPKGDKVDYTSFYTFNDDVTWGNLEFLIDCYSTLGEQRLLDPIRRAMNFYILTQQGNPQGGWAEQYHMDLQPSHARTYEPAGLMPGATYRHAMLMLRFYEYTGDRRFLSRIPDAIAWLESCRLPAEQSENGTKTHPTFVEMGTNRGIYAHRKGADVTNGKYWVDYDDSNLLAHYGGKTSVDIQRLKDEYNRVSRLTPEEATRNSPLKEEQFVSEGTPQQYFSRKRVHDSKGELTAQRITEIVDQLDDKGRWLTKNEWISRPYAVSSTGEETNTARLSDENGVSIRDDSNQRYISVRKFMENMNFLIDYINQ